MHNAWKLITWNLFYFAFVICYIVNLMEVLALHRNDKITMVISKILLSCWIRNSKPVFRIWRKHWRCLSFEFGKPFYHWLPCKRCTPVLSFSVYKSRLSSNGISNSNNEITLAGHINYRIWKSSIMLLLLILFLS